jgi:hypothetical protein
MTSGGGAQVSGGVFGGKNERREEEMTSSVPSEK